MPETVILIFKNTSPLEQTSTICFIKWTMASNTFNDLSFVTYNLLIVTCLCCHLLFLPPVYFSLHASAFSVFWDSGIHIRR